MFSEETQDATIKPQDLDWEDLRAKSLQKGGFGEARVDIWPRLLHVSRMKASEDEKSSNASPVDEKPPHQDERQIGLDTDRSFVLYPVEPNCDRETLQADLHKLLVSLFRKRPRLSYFQGYHDIVTVLFLTLPSELQLLCVEKLSLHRLRDSMGSGLEPVLGLLRVTKNLLRLADRDFALMLERNSPLPFYALSNLLTLFSHDMPTLPLIQHVFDYLFCRPPIAAVYLATAIILSRKNEAIRLQEEDEDGMIHSLLSSLPNLVDDVQNQGDADTEPSSWKTEDPLDGVNNHETFLKEEADESNILNLSVTVAEATEKVEPENQDLVLDHAIGLPDAGKPLLAEPPEDPRESDGKDIDPPEPKYLDAPLETNQLLNEDVDCTARSSVSSPSPEIPPREATIPNIKQEEHPYPPPPPFPADPKPTNTKIFLTDLLKHADALYKEYPPSHSELMLSTIMGPQSVLFTWSESHSGLPSDNTAEAMVSHPELVVYPYLDIDLHEKDTSIGKDEHGSETAGNGRRRRRRLRKSPFGQVEKKTMLAGTVLVLGVAMAVYGFKARNGGGYGLFFGIADGRLHTAGSKDWKRLGGWVGGALTGMSAKIMNGLTSGP